MTFTPTTTALPEIGHDVLIRTNGQEAEYYVGRLLENGRWVTEIGVNAGYYPGRYPWQDAAGDMFELVNVEAWCALPCLD